MENVPEGLKTETKPREIEDVVKDTQKELRVISERVKKEKVDKKTHPIDRTLENLRFASSLTDIPTINEFLREANVRKGYLGGIVLTEGEVFGPRGKYYKPDTTVFLNKHVYILGENFKTDSQGEPLLSNFLKEKWNAGDKKPIEDLAKLSKIDIIKKFQRVISI